MPDGSWGEYNLFKKIVAEDKRLEDEEDIRTLYVAMTRASKRPFLSGGAVVKNNDEEYKCLLSESNDIQLCEVVTKKRNMPFVISNIGSDNRKPYKSSKNLKSVKVPLGMVRPLKEYSESKIYEFSSSMIKSISDVKRCFIINILPRFLKL